MQVFAVYQKTLPLDQTQICQITFRSSAVDFLRFEEECNDKCPKSGMQFQVSLVLSFIKKKKREKSKNKPHKQLIRFLSWDLQLMGTHTCPEDFWKADSQISEKALH